MRIEGNLLRKDDGSAMPFVESPNIGGVLSPDYLVMHFTAGRSATSSIEWFRDPQAKASAHLVIARDGSITQMVPFNKVAWHAGISQWGGRQGLNQFSCGIELDNAGKLLRVGRHWQAWFGAIIPDEEVLEATHKNENQSCGWHTFTECQIEAATEASTALARHYGLKDILGHEDIAPGRKVDPGPAFPMSSFKAKVLGRENDAAPTFRTTTRLNIRSGPGTQFDTLPGSPLLPDTPVQILAEQQPWVRVDVLCSNEGVSDLVGWVHSRFLVRT